MTDLTHARAIFEAVETDMQDVFLSMMNAAEERGLAGDGMARAALQASVFGAALCAAAGAALGCAFIPVSTAIDAMIAAWPEAERMLDEALKEAGKEAGHA